MHPTAQTLRDVPTSEPPDFICALSYEERFLRRRKLVTDCGTEFVVDLPKTTDLKQGDQLMLYGLNLRLERVDELRELRT